MTTNLVKGNGDREEELERLELAIQWGKADHFLSWFNVYTTNAYKVLDDQNLLELELGI
jgi:hypothetical protein